MRLKWERKFGPIGEFEPIDLPDFVLLIGPNGSGKSQFLRAIESGAVFAGVPWKEVTFPSGRVVESYGTQARRYTSKRIDMAGLALNELSTDKAIPDHGMGVQQARQFYNDLRAAAHLDKKALSLIDELGIAPLPKEQLEFWHLGPEGLAELLQIERDSGAYAQIESAFQEADAAIAAVLRPAKLPSRSIEQHLTTVREFLRRSGRRPTSLTPEVLAVIGAWGRIDAFAPAIADHIARYRDLQAANYLANLNSDPNRAQAEFEERFGRAPWLIIDELLADVSLPYRTKPPAHRVRPEPYALRFIDDRAKIEIGPGDLSAGERVLLQFALSALEIDPVRARIDVPDLLLLDEVDAALHPQMLNRWMETLLSDFVGKRGSKCILATHSPVTVALAPEGSIFELVRGHSRPTPISKQEALNRLTVGLPTLAIDYTGQRQVFVESDTDAATFNEIATLGKAQLSLERSLSFISTGFRTKANGEQNAGAATVLKVVRQLRSSGNRQVFGLIDWDGHRSPDGAVRVLAAGTHYTLENLLLDPFLIGALLVLDAPNVLATPFSFLHVKDHMQVLAEQVEGSVSLDGSAFPGTRVNSYLDGSSVVVSRAFAQMPGHDLEQRLADTFPYLRQFQRNRGTLVREIVHRVLTNYPELCPRPLADAFRSIASEDN